MSEGLNGEPVRREGDVDGARWQADGVKISDGRLEVTSIQLWHGPSATPLRLSDGRVTYASFEDLDQKVAEMVKDFIRNMRL